MSDTTKTEDQPAEEPVKIGPDGKPMAKEIGGSKGPAPTRQGEWEVNGRVVDF